MIIAVASENKPKVSACKKVFNELLNSEFDSKNDLFIITRNVNSGVADMPLSIDELMTGAQNRTIRIQNILKKENRPADFYIGLEGGFFIKYNPCRTAQIVFLQSWVYVSNGVSGYWGCSGAIEVPSDIAEPILSNGEELGVVIDQKMNQSGIRSEQGTVGILTNNRILRQDFFESALIFALAPFYNLNMYQ